MEEHVFSFSSCTTGSWTGANGTFTWLMQSGMPPDDEPPAGVPARPRPAPAAPPATALVPA